MRIFKIREGGFDEIKKMMVLKLLRGVGISITIAGIMSVINYMNKGGDIKVILIPFFVLIGISAYRVLNEIKRQKSLFGSYILTIDDNLIKREQLDTPSITILKDEIKAINKHPNGSFKITSVDEKDIIVIPAQITEYQSIEHFLTSIMPISLDEKKSFTERNKQVLGVLNLLLLFFLIAINHKPSLIIISIIIIVSTIWSIIEIQRNKNIDFTTKRKSWWGLLTIVSVLATIIIKFL